jgi:hypothetical protein
VILKRLKCSNRKKIFSPLKSYGNSSCFRLRRINYRNFGHAT